MAELGGTRGEFKGLQRRLSPGAQNTMLAYIILIVVYLGAVAVNHAFLSWGTIRLQLILASFIGIVAVGQTLAILIGQIDLSIPWTITLSAILSSNLYAEYQHAWVAFGAVLAIGVAVGLFNTLGVYVLRVHSLIWTLSVNLVLQGVTLIYTNAMAPSSVIPPAAHFLALGMLAGVPVAPLVWAACAVLVIYSLRFLPFGRYVYSIGNNETASLLSGVKSARTYSVIFVTSSLGAAFTGLMLSGYASQAYLGMGNEYLLTPIAAVVIGGTRLAGGEGGYFGTIAGALIVVLLEAVLITLNVSQGAREGIFGGILLLLVFVFLRRRRD